MPHLLDSWNTKVLNLNDLINTNFLCQQFDFVIHFQNKTCLKNPFESEYQSCQQQKNSIQLLNSNLVFHLSNGRDKIAFSDLTNFRGKGRYPSKKFVLVFGDLKPRKIASEINWLFLKKEPKFFFLETSVSI